MFEKLKNRLFQQNLDKDCESYKAHREIKNLNQIKHIGIVFDGTSFESINQIHDFRKLLEKEEKKVEIFGYIDSNDLKKEPYLISKKNLNWYGYPKDENLERFANIPFDVIFAIYYDKNSPLNVIMARSKAKLRIGAFDEGNEKLFDVLLGLEKSKSTSVIIQSLYKFLKEVKTN